MAIQQGTYSAKIVNCGIKKFGTGKEALFVEFETENDGRISWFGWMGTTPTKTGKTSLDYSIEQLLRIGFTNDWDAFTKSDDIRKCFTNVDKVWSIEVVEESYADKKTGQVKNSTKIKWINDPENPANQKLESGAAVQLVNSLNLKALTLQKRAELGLNAPVAQKKQAVNAPITLEDVPF